MISIDFCCCHFGVVVVGVGSKMGISKKECKWRMDVSNQGVVSTNFVCIEDLVPRDHLLRKIEKHISR